MDYGNQQRGVLCKYNLDGMCRFGSRCWNIHETPASLIEKAEKCAAGRKTPTQEGACALSPSKSKESKVGTSKDNAFGPSTSSVEKPISLVKIAQSEEKTCGICFDTIMKKTVRSEQTFGIMPSCNHCFCFTCIRKWRQSKEFEIDVSKSCPECRIASDFVYASKVWIDTKEEKERFINSQKQRMKKLDCKYFRKGKGTCPFGNTCLYLHALPNGKTMDVGPPMPRRRGVRSAGELVHQILFWLNDDDLEPDTDDDDIDLDSDLDLSDPTIAYQYYEPGDIRRYIALDRLMNGDDDYDSDYDLLFM